MFRIWHLSKHTWTDLLFSSIPICCSKTYQKTSVVMTLPICTLILYYYLGPPCTKAIIVPRAHIYYYNSWSTAQLFGRKYLVTEEKSPRRDYVISYALYNFIISCFVVQLCKNFSMNMMAVGHWNVLECCKRICQNKI